MPDGGQVEREKESEAEGTQRETEGQRVKAVHNTSHHYYSLY